MIQAESNNGISKAGCYLLAALTGFTAVLMLRAHDFHRQPAQGWGYLLLIALIGVVPPLWYAASLKRYRLTIDHEELLLEKLPATVLVRQPMPTLQRWGVLKPQTRHSAGEVLYLRFRRGDDVRINAVEYENFGKVVSFLQSRYPRQRQAAR